MNTLNDLNNILFDTLRGIQENTVTPEKAHAISALSNNIINTAKTTLAAYKMTNAKVGVQHLIGLPEPSETIKQSNDRFQQMNEFALLKGFKSVTDAMDKLGKPGFDRAFKLWIKA